MSDTATPVGFSSWPREAQVSWVTLRHDRADLLAMLLQEIGSDRSVQPGTRLRKAEIARVLLRMRVLK